MSEGIGIEIYPCGTKVNITASGISATIVTVQIAFNNISYLLSFFLDSVHQEHWFYPCEFTVGDNINKVKVGFAK